MDMNARRDESGPDESGPDAFERRARAAFDASVDSLDAGARSRLNQARQQALAAAATRQPRAHRSTGRSWYGTWAPAGALAAAVLAAALLLRTPAEGPSAPIQSVASPTQGESLEMLAADEDFAIATSEEDLEFYAWVELATAATGSG
jgi:hypothetical protein